MPTTDAPAPRAGSRTAPVAIVLVVGATAAGALAVVQPAVGVAAAVVALIATLLRGVPVRRLAPILVVLTAVAAIAGPNLAPPGAGWLFLFRILIVLLGLGVAGYLLMDGRLVIPAGLPRPAGLLAVWFCWMAFSISWAHAFLPALRWTAFMAMMGGLAIAIAMLCRDRRRAQTLLWWLFGTFAVACLIAVGEELTGLHLPTFRVGNEDKGLLIGVGSLFGNQNNFATFLSISLPYFAALPIVYKDVRLKAIGFGGAAAALIFILLAGSKTGVLASGLVLIGLLVVVGSDRKARGRLLVAGATAALAVLLVIPSLLGGGLVKLDERTVTKLNFTVLQEQIAGQSGSGGARDQLLHDGLAIVGETNGLGVGAGNAETRVRTLVEFPGVANLHNWWLEVLVDGGIVALALYLLFYLTLFRRQLRLARSHPDSLVRYMGLAGSLSLLGWVIGSIGPSTAIHFAPMWIMFGLGMGTLVLARRQEGRPSAS
jgi:O-antigen ligase